MAMRQAALILLFLTGTTLLPAGFPGAIATEEKAPGRPYTSADLGFSYTPPSGLRDLTAAIKESESASRQDGRVEFEFLLRMFSGPDDKATDWVTLGIATCPRGRDKDKGDDLTAGFVTNNAFREGTTTERTIVKIAGRNFSMSRFEKQAPPLTKYAVLYTIVHKEKFITFFFSGNDRERVQKLSESMSTVKFHP
jgi:hypothetical protein